MYWGRPVKIDTALYPISTQRNLAVASKNISMLLNPDFYGSCLAGRHCHVPAATGAAMLLPTLPLLRRCRCRAAAAVAVLLPPPPHCHHLRHRAANTTTAAAGALPLPLCCRQAAAAAALAFLFLFKIGTFTL